MIRLLNGLLRRYVQIGSIRMIDAEGRDYLYKGSDGPHVTFRLTDPKTYFPIFINPELHMGEAYMDGKLVFEEGSIRDFLLLFGLNREHLLGYPLQKLLQGAYKMLRGLHQNNSPEKARANAAHHYDLSNALYQSFLDEDLNYSCAYFRKPDESLESAQQNKLRHIAAKLSLKPGQKVLDIGSGWGAMAFYLAETADVEVLGVTLSTEQLELASARARERGLDGRVRFELKDYRQIAERFDRVVSIGMFEHVGIRHYPRFFSKIGDLLADDGVALLHSIGYSGPPSATSPWLRKYIFPGGYTPSLSEVFAAVEPSGLTVTDMEILRLHYAKTLAAWNDRFQANRDRVAALFDERFCRMWEFYLIACEYGFRHGGQMVFQMQLAKPSGTLPITRDYMSELETKAMSC